MIPFKTRLRGILAERGIRVTEFCTDTGIDRASFFHKHNRHHRSTYMAIAYYFDMRVEDLIAGTDAVKDWYGDAGI